MNEKIYVTADKLGSTASDRQSQETSVSWMRSDTTISIDSSDLTFINKMKKLMIRNPDAFKCYYYASNVDKKTNKPWSYVFEFDKKLLSIRAPSSRKYDYTDEEKQQIASRLQKRSKEEIDHS